MFVEVVVVEEVRVIPVDIDNEFDTFEFDAVNEERDPVVAELALQVLPVLNVATDKGFIEAYVDVFRACKVDDKLYGEEYVLLEFVVGRPTSELRRRYLSGNFG